MTTVGNHRSGPAHDLRLLVSVISASVLLAIAGLLCWWAVNSGPDGRASLLIVATVSAVLFFVASADAVKVWRGAHH